MGSFFQWVYFYDMLEIVRYLFIPSDFLSNVSECVTAVSASIAPVNSSPSIGGVIFYVKLMTRRQSKGTPGPAYLFHRQKASYRWREIKCREIKADLLWQIGTYLR